jgi:branched-chain amino acid transport system ATP-binding protein
MTAMPATHARESVLVVRDVRVEFGAVVAVSGVSTEVHAGEIFAIVGPNGAGKSSLLNAINGFYRPRSGEILFKGRNIVGMRPSRVARLGIARTFQNIQLYLGMPVLDNLLAGRHIHMRGGVLRALIRPWGMREEARQREAVEQVLQFLGLQAERNVPVGNFGYGIRKRVDLGRALCMQPQLLLLDEPMAGMTMDEKEDMARFILDVRRATGIPIVIVEHDMQLVSDIADRVLVLDWGQVVATGAPAEVLRLPQVVSAYLGGEAAEAVPR